MLFVCRKSHNPASYRTQKLCVKNGLCRQRLYLRAKTNIQNLANKLGLLSFATRIIYVGFRCFFFLLLLYFFYEYIKKKIKFFFVLLLKQNDSKMNNQIATLIIKAHGKLKKNALKFCKKKKEKNKKFPDSQSSNFSLYNKYNNNNLVCSRSSSSSSSSRRSCCCCSFNFD